MKYEVNTYQSILESVWFYIFNINTFLCQELTWFNIDLLWDATTDEDFLLLCLLLLLLSSPSSKTLFPGPGAFEPWLAIDAWCGGRKFWSLEHTTFRCSLSLSCKALYENMYRWKQRWSQLYLRIIVFDMVYFNCILRTLPLNL